MFFLYKHTYVCIFFTKTELMSPSFSLNKAVPYKQKELTVCCDCDYFSELF